MIRGLRWAGLVAGALLGFALPAAAAETTSSSGSIIVYENTNAGGAHKTYQAATPNLASSDFNDRISSVFVVSGSWQLCTDKDYKGKCVTLGQGLHNLDASTKKLVSSLRPAASQNSAAIVFLDKDGGGKSMRVTGEIRKLADFPGFSSSISSIAVFKGNWEFCRKNDYKGDCITLGPGVYNLTNFNDVIDSLRPK